MIKQSWKISTGEVKRILQLHETATKGQYLIGEQTITKKLEPKTFSLPGQTFESGKHSETSLSQEQKNAITTTLRQIAAYLKEKKGIPMAIQVEAGESLPTNYDNEKTPAVKLGSGKLAELRGETVKKILTDFFNGLVSKGELPKMPNISDAKTFIGKTPRGLDKDDPKYQQEQFIRFKVVATGEETTVCLVGLNILFNYVNEDSTLPLLKGCRGGHTCDKAVFDVYLNKTKVGTADLNNDGCEGKNCNRRAQLTVTPEMVSEIVNGVDFKKSQKLTLWYRCVVKYCHANVPEIYIRDKEGKSLFPNTTFPSPCVATGAQRGDEGPWALMTLDGCGNPLNVSREMSNQEMVRLRDEIAAEEAAKAQAAKEEQQRLEAEQAAKRQQYLDYGAQEGFEVIAGKRNSNVWNIGGVKILNQEIIGSYYVVTVQKLNNSFPNLQTIVDPITQGNTKWAVPTKAIFKIKYPIVSFDYSGRQKKFENENSAIIPIGDGYYFNGYAPPIINGQENKKLYGTVLKPNFK